MKSSPVCSLIVSAAILLSTSVGRADEASYANIIKERASVLAQIVTEQEARRTSGLGDEEAIAAARLALYSFRRDVAAASAEKIKNQELIVGICGKNLENMQAKLSTGAAGNIQVLEARAVMLEAKQVLEELRLRERSG